MGNFINCNEYFLTKKCCNIVSFGTNVVEILGFFFSTVVFLIKLIMSTIIVLPPSPILGFCGCHLVRSVCLAYHIDRAGQCTLSSGYIRNAVDVYSFRSSGRKVAVLFTRLHAGGVRAEIDFR